MAEIESLELDITSNSTNATDALDRLTAALERLDKITGKATGVSKMNTKMTKLNSTLSNITKSVVSVYAIRKVADILGGFIKKSNDYVENMNLFTVSMGRFADEAVDYANTVSDVMGIDPSTWVRNQGVFMTLASGFGVVEERAYTMSKNLTQLGYDLSSFFNIEYTDAMTKLQAGLSGELEPLRRLGYDLSKARLEAVALELGITKSYNAMTQAEKAQLRYYAIMTQVTQAQGDMARTLEQPANQIRVLRAQFEQCSRAIGNIFIPALNAILPYAIAVTKVVREMAEYLAGLAGFTMPEVEWDAGISGITDSAEEAEEATKKLKKSLLGFDELNVLQKDTYKDSGVSADEFSFELPEYDFIGDAVSSKVDEIAAKIREAFSGIGDIALPAFENIGITIEDSFTPALERLKEMLNTTWQQIRSMNWGSAFAGLGTSLIEALGSAASLVVNAFAPVWEALNVPAIVYDGLNTLKEAFYALSAVFDSLNPGITAFVQNGIAPIVEWISGTVIDALQWLQEGLRGISNWFTENEPVFTALLSSAGDALGSIWGAVEPIFSLAWDWLKGIVEEILQFAGDRLIDMADSLTDVFNWISDIFDKLGEYGVIEGLSDIIGGLLDMAEGMLKTIIGILTGDWELAWEGWNQGIEGSKSIWDGLGKTITGIVTLVIDQFTALVVWLETKVVQPVGKFFKELGEKISSAFTTAFNAVKTAWGKAVNWFQTTIITPVKNAFQNLVQNIRNIFTNFKWSDIGRNIVNGIKNGIQSAWSGLKTAVSGAFDNLVGGVKGLLGIHSPSTVFIKIGEYTMEGLEIGISKQAVSAANTMRDSMNRVVSSASAQSGRIANRTAVSIERNESGSSYDDSAAMAEQNALLREQNRIMEQLLRKETVAVVSPSASLGRVVSRSQQMYAAMAGG